MAVQPIDYLKEKFNNLKTPNGKDFSDLIDSCVNAPISALSGNFVFTVNGSVSANGYVYDVSGNSSEWNSVYSNVQSNSANWDSSYTTVNSNSGNWDAAFASAGVDALVRSLTGDWVGGNDAYTNLVSNSAAYLSGVDLNFLSVSANWDSVYTAVNANSASWDAAFASAGVDALVRSLTGDWVGGNDAYTNLVSNSAAYLSGVDLNFLSVSANWDSSYTTVNSNSGNWDYQGLDIKSLSADWKGGNSAYTTVNTNSANNWDNSKSNEYTHLNFLPLSGGTLSGRLNISASNALSAGLNIGAATAPTNPIPGDIWIGSPSLNWRTINGTFNAVSTSIPNIFNREQSINVNTTTDAFRITQIGTGHSLRVEDETNPDATPFIIDNIGSVGVGLSSVTGIDAKLTVVGNISATGTLFTSGGNSNNWNSSYTTVNSNSAAWNSTVASAGTDIVVRSLTGGWVGGNSAYTTVNTNSANWDYQGLDIKSLSADWVGGNDAYTNLVSNSAAYLSGVDLNFLSVSANWNSAYTTINAQSANNVSVYTTVNSNSATTWNYQGTDLKNLSSGWVGGNSAYTSVNSNSANWNSVYSNVNSNSATYTTISFANNKFLPLTGGNITGKTHFYDNVTVYGNISATGNSYFANTIYSTTSALSVINIGNTGPAIYVGNNGSGDIASFYDIDQNIEILHVGGNNSLYPNVGIKVSNPNKDFTVKGELSASSIIWDSNGNSNQWNSVYSNVNSNSAAWNLAVASAGTDIAVRSLTGGWVGGNAAYTSVNSNSANWNSVYTSVNANSATTWNYQGTDLKGLSSGWVGGNAAYTNLVSNSAAYLSGVDLSFLSVSANWNSVYTSVNANSANNTSVYTSVNSNSAAWNSTVASAGTDIAVRSLTGGWVGGNSSYTTVNANSATTWNYQGTDLKNLSSGWVGGNAAYTNLVSNSAAYLSAVDLSFLSISGNWNSVYSNVNANSATTWNYQGTDLKNLSSGWVGGNSSYTTVNANSANWNSVYTTVSTNSATYATISFANNKFLPLSGGIINGDLTITGNLSTLGSVTQINTQVFVTSAVSVTNTGTGPALTVKQTGAQDIATFFDDSNTALIIKDGGNVGIGTTSPSAKLTVSGNVSASGNITIDGVTEVNKPIDYWSNTSYYDVSNFGSLASQGSYEVNLTSNGYRNSSGTWTSLSATTNNYTGAAQIRLNGQGYVYISTDAIKGDGSPVNPTTRLTVTKDGDVGIGTTSPTEKLTVVGNIGATGNLTNDGNIYLGKSARNALPNTINNPAVLTTLRTWTSATDADIDNLVGKAQNTDSRFGTIIESISAGHFVIGLRNNDSSDVFSILSQNKSSTYTKNVFTVMAESGNVGIGTSTPSVTLHLSGSSGGETLRIDAVGNAGIQLVNTTTSNPSGYTIYLEPSTGNLKFNRDNPINTGVAEIMTFNDDKVGIRTSTPKEALDVTGNITTTGNLTAADIYSTQERFDLFNSSKYRMALNSSQWVFANSSDIDLATIDLSGNGHFAQPSNFWLSNQSYYAIGSTTYRHGGLASEGSYEVNLTSNGYRNSSGTWTSLSATNNNYTGAAQIRLNPQGYIQFSTDGVKGTGSSVNPTTRMTITSSGNVGIGTTTPDSKLDINGDIRFYRQDNDSQYVLLSSDEWGHNFIGFSANNNSKPFTYNSTTTAANPSDLPSDGGNCAHRFRIMGTDVLRIEDNFNVGIGVSVPNEKLTVVGNISATGNFISSNNYYLTDNRTAIGSTRTGYFGTALTLLANKIYELEYHLYFKNNNTSATTVVNYALSGNKEFSNVNANFMQDVGGAGAVSTGTTVGSIGPTVDLGNTETLAASISAYGILKSIVTVGASDTSVSIALSCNNSSGVTPLKGSYRKVTQFN